MRVTSPLGGKRRPFHIYTRINLAGHPAIMRGPVSKTAMSVVCRTRQRRRREGHPPDRTSASSACTPGCESVNTAVHAKKTPRSRNPLSRSPSWPSCSSSLVSEILPPSKDARSCRSSRPPSVLLFPVLHVLHGVGVLGHSVPDGVVVDSFQHQPPAPKVFHLFGCVSQQGRVVVLSVSLEHRLHLAGVVEFVVG